MGLAWRELWSRSLGAVHCERVSSAGRRLYQSILKRGWVSSTWSCGGAVLVERKVNFAVHQLLAKQVIVFKFEVEDVKISEFLGGV